MQTDPIQQPTSTDFQVDQRVHFIGQPTRLGTVKYVGAVQGYSGVWVGVDWDAHSDGKHDGSHNGIRYFTARGPNSASFVRPHNLTTGVSLLQAFQTRYQPAATTEHEQEEMYVLSASNKRVSIQLLGKDKIEDKLSRFEELTSASLSYLGVSFCGSADHVSSTLPNLKELDLTGNLLCNWEDVGIICKALPALTDLNISGNLMSPNITTMPELSNIRILVLNHTGVLWEQVEILKGYIPHVEELHLMGNNIREITVSTFFHDDAFLLDSFGSLGHSGFTSWESESISDC